MKEKYHYIYKTTCIINNKYYIGMHSTSNINDGYIGSGKRLKYSINKYGIENHICEKLEFFLNREELVNRIGSSNSQYGTGWITNEIDNKKIKKSDTIPDGWRLGRKLNNGTLAESGMKAVDCKLTHTGSNPVSTSKCYQWGNKKYKNIK